jgi:hypothetical protein
VEFLSDKRRKLGHTNYSASILDRPLVGAWIYAAVSTILPVWWFAIGRWRYKAKINSEPT